ncbi:MAG: hypothetical protein JW963_02760 [Anaerolineales bacterium]|nr:hypothetical protein [Anaerolineales bacterium]
MQRLHLIGNALRVLNVLDPVELESRQIVSSNLSRAAAVSQLRQIDPTRPITWEFSAFSQNGEDGIIDYLTRQLKYPNLYFVEIGAGKGTENNTSWLMARKYSGLMIDGNCKKTDYLSCYFIPAVVVGLKRVKAECLFVTRQNAPQIQERMLFSDPDVFSLDIDGVDFYIAEALMELGIRPKIFVVEYNSAFGPENSVTVEYQDNFDYQQLHSSLLYYGASLTAWKRLFQRYGYQFLTVESGGTNAFFVNSTEFDSSFVHAIQGEKFRENSYQLQKFKVPWEQQFEIIKELKFVEVT